MIGQILLVFACLLCIPSKSKYDIRQAGMSNGHGYRLNIKTGDFFHNRIYQVLMKDAHVVAYLHGQTTVKKVNYLNDLIIIIAPNGVFHKFEHDEFFNNVEPFDEKQLAILFAVQFPVWELVKVLSADIICRLRKRGWFPHMKSFAGYMVNG